jgi:hypothetical protein
MRQILVAVATVVSGLAFSAFALKFFLLPWFLIGLSISAAAVTVSAVVPRSWRLVIISVGSLPVAVSLAEIFVTAPPLQRKFEVPPPRRARFPARMASEAIADLTRVSDDEWREGVRRHILDWAGRSLTVAA